MRPLPSAVLVAAALLAAGCVSPPSDLDAASAEGASGLSSITPVRERAGLPFATDAAWSRTLVNGTYGILPALSVSVPVSVAVGQGLPTQNVHMGIFLPEIPGCDFAAMAEAVAVSVTVGEVNEATQTVVDCRVPVVADVGPYYGEPLLGDVHATEPANRLGKFLIENLVPHGYAVAQVSVMGTGDSGGCMDLMGEVEQAGVQAAVDYLGQAEWSNGAVGLIGRSYDGSTPWEAAMVGSPYLKTVVPISGLYGQQDLMWRNGSAESRGPALLWGLYYVFALSGNEQDPALQAQQIAENLVCPDSTLGPAHGAQAYATGGKGPDGYWQERSFKEEVLANYEGSVYFIHGMQDWNVDPHMAFPFYNELEAKGLEMKGLFGQWAHMYPDRPGEHAGCGDCTEAAGQSSVRWDWAQDLLEWFDHYLKGTGEKPELHVEMQDDAGRWRIEPTWPPADVNWTEIPVDGAGGTVLVPAPADPNGQFLAYVGLEGFDRDVIIAGLPQLKLAVTPTGPGGQVYVELRDMDDGGRRLGHAIMDLRYHAGGEDMQVVVPGQQIVAQMEFFPMDAALPAGHKIGLFFAATGKDYLPSVINAPLMLHLDGSTILRLPIVERAPEDFFVAPAGGKAAVATEAEP